MLGCVGTAIAFSKAISTKEFFQPTHLRSQSCGSIFILLSPICFLISPWNHATIVHLRLRTKAGISFRTWFSLLELLFGGTLAPVRGREGQPQGREPSSPPSCS